MNVECHVCIRILNKPDMLLLCNNPTKVAIARHKSTDGYESLNSVAGLQITNRTEETRDITTSTN